MRQPARCQLVRAVGDHASVHFLVRLVCSDPGCAERIEEAVVSLDALDALVCDCGCSWELLAVSLDADSVAA